jgi:hypothetical protein
MQSKLKMRHFEAVIALAEEMHYGRAAKRVGLTQFRTKPVHSERRARSKIDPV